MFIQISPCPLSHTTPTRSHASDAFIPCSYPQPYWECSFRVWLHGKEAEELPSDAFWIWNLNIFPFGKLTWDCLQSTASRLEPSIGCAEVSARVPVSKLTERSRTVWFPFERVRASLRCNCWTTTCLSWFILVFFYISVSGKCFSQVRLKTVGRSQETIRALWDNPSASLACSMLTWGKTLTTTKCKTSLTTATV